MKRIKLGDLFTIRVPNGYKLFQWAYRIPRKGDFVRVFDGLYDVIPNNLEEIVSGPHSYILAFSIHKAYRSGLAQLLGNFPVPSIYPFPKYQIHFLFAPLSKKIEAIHVMSSDATTDVWKYHYVSRMEDLPEEYRGTTLLNSYLTPNWILYLFDVGFDLKHLERFEPGPNAEDTLREYTAIINKYYS